MKSGASFAPRLLAGFGAAALLGAVCLVSSRPAHTAGGPIAVNVANTPISTAAADDPAKQPFQATRFVENNSVGVFFSPVPVGKRLVIESINTFSNIRDDSHSHTLYLGPNGTVDGFQEFDISVTAAPYHAITQKILSYTDAGQAPEVIVATDDNSAPKIYVTLCGHFVDVP